MDAKNRLANQQKDSLYKDFVKIISPYVEVTDGPKGQQKKIWKLKNTQGATEVWIDGGKQYHFHLDENENNSLRFDMNPIGTICGICLTIEGRGQVIFNNGEAVNSVMVGLAGGSGNFKDTPGEDFAKAVKEEQKKMQGEEDKKEEEINDDDELKKTNKKNKKKKKKKKNKQNDSAEVQIAQQRWLRLGNGLQVLELRKEGSMRKEIINGLKNGLKKQKAQKDIKNLANNLANKMRNNKFSQLKSGLNDNQLLGGYYGCMFEKQFKTYQLEKDRMEKKHQSQMKKVLLENNKLKNTVAQLKNKKDALMMDNNVLKGKQTEMKSKLAATNKQLDIAKNKNINLEKTTDDRRRQFNLVKSEKERLIRENKELTEKNKLLDKKNVDLGDEITKKLNRIKHQNIQINNLVDNHIALRGQNNFLLYQNYRLNNELNSYQQDPLSVLAQDESYEDENNINNINNNINNDNNENNIINAQDEFYEDENNINNSINENNIIINNDNGENNDIQSQSQSQRSYDESGQLAQQFTNVLCGRHRRGMSDGYLHSLKLIEEKVDNYMGNVGN